MRYGSVCSGIEAASVAWHHLGWQAVFFSEIEPFPRAVLAERWPGVPIHGDFTTIEKDTYEPIDLLVCGTPCQDFSVAGLRAGLAGERGFLTIEFVRLAERLRPRWLVWENVPGVLSSDDGRAFGLFLGALGECGYGTAWRVLDAQHFGVPQRRRRVFVVGYLGDWRPPAAVLFERESLRGDTAPRRAAGERVAPCLEACANRTGDDRPPGTCVDTADSLIALRGHSDYGDGLPSLRFKSGDCGGGSEALIVPPLMARSSRGGTQGLSTGFTTDGHIVTGHPDPAYAISAGKQGEGGVFGSGRDSQDTFVTHSLRAEGFDASEDGTGRGLVTHALNVSGRGGDVTEDGTGRGVPLIAVDARNGTIGDQTMTLAGGCDIGSPSLNSTPLTLAIRGRGDSHDLEYRQDGIANAILTPNGGRAGIGVGAVAVPLQCNGTNVGTDLPSLRAGNGHITGGGPAIAYGISSDCIDRSGEGDGSAAERAGLGIVADASPSIRARPNNGVAQAMSVRRLTPVECARLQGFPDDYLDITYRKKPAADGPKYRALGNSMAVPCMRWIGERIAMVEGLL
jgi:DNA (cytosine-5)-methyltransferase 1